MKQALRALAANSLSGRSSAGSDDPNRVLLASKYEELVGDAGAAARGVVDVILATLAAGVQVDLSADPGARAVSGQLQATGETILAKLDDMTELMTVNAASEEVRIGGRQASAESLEEPELRRIALDLLTTGSPPSLLRLFPGAPDLARQALEHFSQVRRTVRDPSPRSSKNQITTPIADLFATNELHHLVLAPPGSGKTHALWHVARDMLAGAGLIPFFLPLGNLASWAEVVQAVADFAGGIDATLVLRDPRVCVLLDGWSEFASGYGTDERGRATRVLSRTRIVANSRHGMTSDGSFRVWNLDPPPMSAVEKAIRIAFPGSPPPGPALMEQLRLPLALSLFILLGGSATTRRGELLTRLHDHLSRDLPEGVPSQFVLELA